MINYQISPKLSEMITALRTPMMLLLAFDHFNIMTYEELKGFNGAFPIMISGYEEILISFITMCGMCVVPACFFISGILLYNGWDGSFEICQKKLKSRVKTLLIPYVIWISLWFISMSLHYYRRSDVTYNIGIISFLAQYWDVSQFPWFVVEGQKLLPDGPLYPHFWYIRYLMILVVVSPLLLILLKKLPKFILALSGVLWLVHPSILHYSYQIGYLGMGGVFFFLCGAYVTMYGGGKVWKWLLNINALFPLVFFLVSFIIAFNLKNTPYVIYVERISIMIGIASFFSICRGLLERGWRLNHNIINASFMIYAMHFAFISLWKMIWVEILQPSTERLQLALWVLAVFSNVTTCILFDMITKKYMPKLNSLLTGGRVSIQPLFRWSKI